MSAPRLPAAKTLRQGVPPPPNSSGPPRWHRRTRPLPRGLPSAAGRGASARRSMASISRSSRPSFTGGTDIEVQSGARVAQAWSSTSGGTSRRDGECLTRRTTRSRAVADPAGNRRGAGDTYSGRVARRGRRRTSSDGGHGTGPESSGVVRSRMRRVAIVALALLGLGAAAWFEPWEPGVPLLTGRRAPGRWGCFVNSAGEIFAMSLWAPYIDVGRNPDGSVIVWAAGTPGSRSTAWYYDHPERRRDRGSPREGAPRGVVTNPLRTGAISYNPDQWRFLDVVGPDPYNLTPPPPGSHEEPFTRRDTPFPDLPDTD